MPGAAPSAAGRPRRRRHPAAAATPTRTAAAAAFLLLLSLSSSSSLVAHAQADDDNELARIAAITTVLDLSAPTPAVSGGSLVFAGGRMRAAAAGAPGGEGGDEASAQRAMSPEEAEAAYDALQAQVEARLEQERQDALRVLEQARQGGLRTSAEEGDAAATEGGPSADEVARAAAIAEHPWRAHRCTTALPSDEARDRMDEAVRADLQKHEEAPARRRLHNHDHHHHSHRRLNSAEDPFDVEFTPDPFSGLSRQAVVAAAEAARRNPTVVRTFLHVVAPTASAGPSRGAVADATLLAQMRVLNATYSSAGFQFRLEAVTRVISSSFSTAEVASGAERSMKRALRRGGRDSLNIFVTSPPALLGWSTFPESARDDRDYDGVVIGFYTLPGSSMKPYNKGMTMAHEVGHWLGLLHTFEGEGCGGLGDRVSDTPREASPAFGCPARGSVDTCPSDPGADSTSNFMQYTDDACMSSFTPGQVARMAALWRQYRATEPAPAVAAESGDEPTPQSSGGEASAENREAPSPPPPRRRRRVTPRGG